MAKVAETPTRAWVNERDDVSVGTQITIIPQLQVNRGHCPLVSTNDFHQHNGKVNLDRGAEITIQKHSARNSLA